MISKILGRLDDLFFAEETEHDLNNLPKILDHQASEQPLGGIKIDRSNEWAQQKLQLDALLRSAKDVNIQLALKTFSKIVDILDMYTPSLKGLQEVHAYTCEKLEGLVFDGRIEFRYAAAAAYLYGQAMSMFATTSEAIAPAIENILPRGDNIAANLVLCILLGAERSNPLLFENNLYILLQQIQVAAFAPQDKTIPREALLSAMKVYSNSSKTSAGPSILHSTHALLIASLELCKTSHTLQDGVTWACFIIKHLPLALRIDLRVTFDGTLDAAKIFDILASTFPSCLLEAKVALCGALPILTTWETRQFCDGPQVKMMVKFMVGMPGQAIVAAMEGLGLLASVVLDRFEPYLEEVAHLALAALHFKKCPQSPKAAQHLLSRLLAAMGPITLDTMIMYLRSSPSILLSDVGLLEMLATLLPNLTGKIIQILTDIIDDLMSGRSSGYQHESILQALSVFPLDDPDLALKSQKLVLWSLNEDKGKNVVMAALQLATNPYIATQQSMRVLTFRAAQLLLADDAHIVHVALSVLSNPALASSLDERSCSMILLALHQSLEPSIQIVAAKLLTHLTTAHRAIVQPLAWSHIRQSLSLMDFLKTVDPRRAIIEACIISNLLPALPPALHKKYVHPVKELILSGLERSAEAPTLSLVFQGLANLAKVEDWDSSQQSQLALDLLEMTTEIPKDSQHAALNAISRLLSVPQEGLDVYELLLKVHATFGGRGAKLDSDLKSLVSGIYGHLGTVERNPIISRDSKAAINRETSIYTPRTILISQVAEIRDKYGADSSSHVNWLVTKNLVGAMAPTYKAHEERTVVLETMTSLGILQPQAITSLIPDLPLLVMRELKLALGAREEQSMDGKVGDAVLFLASALHMGKSWLQTHWAETADVLADCVTAGDSLAVLKGLDVVLDAVSE